MNGVAISCPVTTTMKWREGIHQRRHPHNHLHNHNHNHTPTPNMSSLLEKSLDEIIGSRPRNTPAKRGNRAPKPRHSNGPRHAPRREQAPRQQHANSRPTLIKVTNLHPDLTAQDLHRLFSTVGPVVDVSLRVNTHGKAVGTAFVDFEYPQDAMRAIREYDGRLAAGQIITVTTTMPLADRIGRAPGASAAPARENRREKARAKKGKKERVRKQPKSLEDLDKELTMYMNGEAGAEAPTETSADADANATAPAPAQQEQPQPDTADAAPVAASEPFAAVGEQTAGDVAMD